MSSSSLSLTAHIDCSNGICVKTLFAACWDAATATTTDGRIQNGVGLTHDDLFMTYHDRLAIFGDVRGDTLLNLESKKLNLVPQPKREDNCNNNSIITMFKERVVGWTNFWKMYPIWVAETSKKVLEEICTAAAEQQPQQGQKQSRKKELVIDGDDATSVEFDAYLHLYYLIAIIQCMDSMNVRDVSYMPLPANLLKLGGTVRTLLGGMTVDPTRLGGSTLVSSTMSATIGVALLRVLSVNRVSNTNQSPTGSILLLERFGSGTNEHDLQISIVVGRRDESSNNIQCHPIIADTVPRSSSHSSKDGRYRFDLWHSDLVIHMETNMDDITGEQLAFVIELLLTHGALDAWVTPIVMKKGRPAYTLHCLCKQDNDDDDDDVMVTRLLEVIFRHTTTLGVRIHRNIPRATLDRSCTVVTTPYTNSTRKGLIEVKICKFISGEIVSRKAEFDNCKEISMETGVPLKWVADEAVRSSMNDVNM